VTHGHSRMIFRLSGTMREGAGEKCVWRPTASTHLAEADLRLDLPSSRKRIAAALCPFHLRRPAELARAGAQRRFVALLWSWATGYGPQRLA